MLELPRAEELIDPRLLASFPIFQSSVVARATYMEGDTVRSWVGLAKWVINLT